MNAQTHTPPQDFQYDAAEAQAADSGQRIDETGAFIGVFTKMKWHVAASGAAGYQYDFESEAGQTAERITIYTISGAGKPIDMGQRKMSALLCCMGVAKIKATPAVIEESEYDENQGKFVTVKNEVYLYPEIMNKPVGIFFHAEDYTDQNGVDRRRINHFLAFQAKSKRTAKEMFEGKAAQDAGNAVPAPHQVDDLAANLKDKDSRKSGGQQNGQQYNGNGQPVNTTAPGYGAPYLAPSDNDDIPYNF